MPSLRSKGATTPDCSVRASALPLLKAAPVELLRGAKLVRKAEIIYESLGFSPPTAAPGEVEDMRAECRMNVNGSDKVGASCHPSDHDLLDLERCLDREELREQALDFDARNVGLDLYALRSFTGEKRRDVSLELGCRA